LEQSTKKSLNEMSTQLAEAQRDKAKAESECSALKGSVGSMKESWAREVKGLRGELKKADEGWKQERDEVLGKNAALLKLVQDQS
jgi:S-methylmethionine-dependent homocysteine/selenocysteine methylase